jgi:hypothetical protein
LLLECCNPPKGVAEAECRHAADAAEAAYKTAFDVDGTAANDKALAAEHTVGEGWVVVYMHLVFTIYELEVVCYN